VSLRAEHVRQTRAALVAAARRLFGEQGYASTSVEQIAADAGVTIGALYHHFATKTALFETVFEELHIELLDASARAATKGSDPLDQLARAFESWFDAVLDPAIQRIAITDATAVLGLERFTELDEKYAFGAIVAGLKAAKAAGDVQVKDPETVARLLLGALTRGGMLIANAGDPTRTRNAVARSLRELLAGLAPSGRSLRR
jgi:AcrR family transcriptional regulator